MQYNSHATNQDLVTLAEKLTKSNSTSFPISEKTLYANLGNRIIMSTIHSSYGGWKYDDSNETDFPIATTNLVSGQDDYALPGDASFLQAVYIQKEGSSEWKKLMPKPLEDFNNEAEDYRSNGEPIYFRPIGDSFKIYPASDYAQASSLKIEYTRDIAEFATTDTTQTPGFDSQFHEAIAIYMAWQYSIANNLDTQKLLAVQWADILARISIHYSEKWKRLFPAKIRVKNKTNYYI